MPLDEHTRAIAEAAAIKAVEQHMATCPIMAEFRSMHVDMYGVPGEKDQHPGLMGDMQAVRNWQTEFQSRVDKHVGRIWKTVSGIVASVVGAVAAWCLSNWHSR